MAELNEIGFLLMELEQVVAKGRKLKLERAEFGKES